MANIANELQTISEKRYGEEVRGAIHDSIEKINTESSNSKRIAETQSDSIQNMANESETLLENSTESISQALNNSAKITEDFENYTTWPKDFSIEDENSNPITDENSNPIIGKIIFFVKQ